ncbi:alpha/beta hydrolase fold protein [Thermobispora bispora DSM 43833]|jgi:pimeloyl-ACP methyl ester carboxylesterase|uniref:Alpha/beta hydrolase fold protein n=2 Tax=Thermobispora bispora TaxID=2006 RepID=D6Y3F7_THEBD|nr:alpha/beta hydrolase fold protein [Thermobispora bispora DSM 43833]MBO2474465.1 alpha/beta hydrolase [Actinomycetales bacterium]QSI46965.1 alpha/beta hydrolase [Thermobispora bispora]
MGKGRRAVLMGLTVGAAAGTLRRRAAARRARERERFFRTTGRKVTVTTDDGARIAAEVDDHPAPRAAVVFTHGWLMSRHCWRYQRDALAGRALLVSYDHRGHGESSAAPLDAYTIDRLGDDLAAVIEATVPSDLPVILAGHSMGGMTIMALAQRHPGLIASRVAGVALLSTSAGWRSGGLTYGLPGPVGRFAARATPRIFDALLARAEEIDRRPRLKELAMLPVTRLTAFGKKPHRADVRFVNAMATATATEPMVAFFHQIQVHDRLSALQALQDVETLIIVGERDRLTPPSDSRRIAKALPGARLIITPDAGHMIGIERPGLVNQELLGLLQRATERGAAGRLGIAS